MASKLFSGSLDKNSGIARKLFSNGAEVEFLLFEVKSLFSAASSTLQRGPQEVVVFLFLILFKVNYSLFKVTLINSTSTVT